MTPGIAPAVFDIPVTIDLWRIGAGASPFVGEIDTIDRQLVQIPGIDVGAEVAGLPAERPCPIPGERRRDRGIHRAAGGSAPRGGSAARGRGRTSSRGADGRRGAATTGDRSGEAVDGEADIADPRFE